MERTRACSAPISKITIVFTCPPSAGVRNHTAVMASLPTAGLNNFAVHCGAEGSSSDKLVATWGIVREWEPSNSDTKPEELCN